MRYLIILLLAFSCSEEELSPKCQAIDDACKTALRQMDQATNAKDKEQYRQFYLSYKHDLESCKKSK
jgi:hypothetical protein